jgi:hypothetical protein
MLRRMGQAIIERPAFVSAPFFSGSIYNTKPAAAARRRSHHLKPVFRHRLTRALPTASRHFQSVLSRIQEISMSVPGVSRTRPFALPRALRDRLRGPGGYYNMGNALGLIVGVTLQIGVSDTAAGALGDFLAGSGSAVALTLANLVFVLSGEAYHRAWSDGAPPDARLNRLGDTLSGVGAIGLGVGLLMLGHPLLALFSGLLHAFGKFGSALHGDSPIAFMPQDCPSLFRVAVLASRFPAIMAAVFGLLALVSQPALPAPELIATLTLLVSYLLWTKADLMLFDA